MSDRASWSWAVFKMLLPGELPLRTVKKCSRILDCSACSHLREVSDSMVDRHRQQREGGQRRFEKHDTHFQYHESYMPPKRHSGWNRWNL
ncbi:hypothetical protein PHLCEN_2v4123 [Hermanssonia centrifuga]|uniref:Uncharacterized protein n=1 Tax=Hermanssonia centrifuga TaxID=98765 RepID=A0A2R6PZ70_9APHY|nr:hypothetical protein PHLCEN_2v4123 [Hermanssonia centrifuga]